MEIEGCRQDTVEARIPRITVVVDLRVVGVSRGTMVPARQMAGKYPL